MPPRPLVLALVLAALAMPARAEEPGPGATALGGPLSGLDDPALTERMQAVRRLVAGLPATRELVLQAFPDAPYPARLGLVDVLAADASAEALGVLLEALREEDAQLTARIHAALVENPDSHAAIESLWREDPALQKLHDGSPRPSALALARVLERAQVERLFLERKSKSGSTGYYKGQYESLRPHRIAALKMLIAIVQDQALAVPGRFRVGRFRFLLLEGRDVDVGEVQTMACNAYAELATPDDAWANTQMKQFAALTDREIQGVRRSMWGEERRLRLLELEGRYADAVVAIYNVLGPQYQADLDQLISDLETRSMSMGDTRLPGVLLRVGRFEEAIEAFQRELGSGMALSPTIVYYNLACAYASWSLEAESPLMQVQRRQQAVYYLGRAVDENWSDLDWMTEDRDLDPIREMPEYQLLVQRIERDLRLPPDDD